MKSPLQKRSFQKNPENAFSHRSTRSIQKSAHESKTRKPSISSFHKTLKRYSKIGLRNLLLSPWFHQTVKVTGITIVVIAVLATSHRYISTTFANEVVISQSEIISRVALLTTLPDQDPIEIVRVEDDEVLKKQNPFYVDAKEGDYVIVYKNMVIIYDLRNDKIVALKKDK